MMNLSENEILMVKRKRAGLRLTQIAKKMGCTLPLLSMFENGKCYLGNDKLEQYKAIINEALREKERV